MNLPSLLTVLFSTTLAPIGDLYVDQAAPNCPIGSGTALDPVCTVPDAIALASPGDTIHIAPGTYISTVVLPFDLNLVGTSGLEVTILDGGGAGPVITMSSPINVIVDGVTLRNGHASTTVPNPVPNRGIGGGVAVQGNFTIRNSTITQNRTSGHMGSVGGGGIGTLGSGSTIVIDTCSILDNFSDFYGGGIFVKDCDLTIVNSLIADNRTFFNTYPGCGIHTNASRVAITNTTISGNESIWVGSALFAKEPLPGSGMWHSTVSDNWGYYSSIYVKDGSFELGNTIVSERYHPVLFNYAPVHQVISGSITSAGYNLIETGGAGFVHGVNGDIVGTVANPVVPLMDSLADNGGPTHTHALFFGAPAIDAGGTGSFPPFDQRGIPRAVGNAPDIGAFEGAGPDLNWCVGNGGNQSGCTDCPCGNNAAPDTFGGCLNHIGLNARLRRTGSPSVSLPPGSRNDLRFRVTNIPTNSLCVLMSGDAAAPAGLSNPCLGLGSGVRSISYNGLRCAVLNTRRHGARQATGSSASNVAPWGGEGSPDEGLAHAFGGFVAGDTRFFQVVYRDTPTAVCTRTLNTTQGFEVTFTP